MAITTFKILKPVEQKNPHDMKKIMLCLVVVFVCSCDNKIKSTDVQFVDNEIVYKDNTYTGQVWSKDGKSLVVEVSDGRPVKITLFHKIEIRP